jgi:hypothetical protein
MSDEKMRKKDHQGESMKSDHYFRNCTHGINWLTSPSFPSDKGEWRAAFDENSGFIYFYNRRTRETTWTKPANFKQWKVVEDDVAGGNVFYYNVLTRTTSRGHPENVDGRRIITQMEHKTVGQQSSIPSCNINIQNDDSVSLYSSLCEGISPFTDYERVEKISKHLDCPFDEKTSTIMQWLKHLVPSQQNLAHVKEDSHNSSMKSECNSFDDRDPPVINIIRNGRLRVQYL